MSEISSKFPFGNIYSYSNFGYEGNLINVEADIRNGLKGFDIVGISDEKKKYLSEIIINSITNSGQTFPENRVLVSLSPSDIRKNGNNFDLPIALSILTESDIRNNEKTLKNSVLVMGELENDGKIRSVSSIYSSAYKAKEFGINYMICPKQNINEALKVPGINVLGADSLNEALIKSCDLNNFECSKNTNNNKNITFNEELYNELKKQNIENYDRNSVRAIEIAIAGKHNINITGAPGCSKTLAISNLFPALTPQLTNEESQSVNRIYSISDLFNKDESKIKNKPFRSPHQTATIEGMLGGGPNCRPGEVTLAHNGTLFLDEAPEFRSSVIQMLRVPLEHQNITLSRAGRSTTYPADFQLAMATQPCPCGCLGTSRACLCSSRSVEMYNNKFTTLMDRIEINVFINNDDKKHNDITPEEMKKHIENAYLIQRKNGIYNQNLSPENISSICKLDKETNEIFNKIISQYNFSSRKINQSLKVAYTIANMEGRENINAEDIKEACSFVRPVINYLDYNNDYLKKDIYQRQEEKNNDLITEKENQKTFLEETSNTFKNNILNNTNNKAIIVEEKLLNGLSKEQIKELENNILKQIEEYKKINEDKNINALTAKNTR